jgi:ABC-type dipeptide/oligopeptide/nickel transport system permease subunit
MAMAVTDLFLSLPWLFLLITARALMPLNVSIGLGAGDISAAGASGLDDCGASLVHNRGIFAFGRILCGRREPLGFQDNDCFGYT